MNSISKRTRSIFGLVLMLSLLAPASAFAFCGFYVSGADTKLYNNATMAVMMRDGTKTVLSMQNNYEGPASNFAMVVPVPVVLKKENVKTLTHQLFDKVDKMASPRLVEYFERDPCKPVYNFEDTELEGAMVPAAPPTPKSTKTLGVKIEAKFNVAEYKVLVLSAKDSNGLEKWLKQEKYNIPKGAAPALKPYVQKGMYFFVAKVDIKKVKYETIAGKKRAVLSPLRFHYDSKEFSLPVRLGLLNAKGKQDLIVHILAKKQRYEVANKPNVTIPTNLIVKQDVKKRFGEFYATLFDYALEENPGAVVTEYAWDAATCDPCPGPTLNRRDFQSLGADIATGGNGGWVLTRLHARYDAKGLKDDLVFKKADPIVGGRGTPVGKEGVLKEEGSKKGSYNNFQGRYIMLNPWKGKVDCKKPNYGNWGGQPPQAAQNTAFAPRGKMSLTNVVNQSTIPGLKKFKSSLKTNPKKEAPKKVDNKSPETKTPIKKSVDAKPKSGCSQTNGSPDSSLVLLLCLGLIGFFRRKQ